MRGTGGHLWGRINFIGDLSCLDQTGGLRTIWVEQPNVRLLLGKRQLAPAEIAHGFGAMGKDFSGPQLDHFGQGAVLYGAQFTGLGCCSITHQRPRPTARYRSW